MLPPNVIEVNTYTNKPSNDILSMRSYVRSIYGDTIKGKPLNQMSDSQVKAIALRLGYK